MKKMLLFIFLLLTAHVLSAQSDISQLQWLAGQWVRTNAKPGITNTESWSILYDGTMSGLGITLHGTDTAVIEKMTLLKKDGNLFYVADVKENPAPVYFKVTSMTTNGFICEDPIHDFPKMISYANDGNNLKVTISGNGRAIDYLFKKVAVADK